MAATGGRAKEACLLRHGAGVQAVCLLPSEENKDQHERWVVATGDAGGRVAVWDVGVRRAMACVDGAHCAHYGVLSLSPVYAGGDGEDEVVASPLLLSQGRDGWLRAWRWAASELRPAWEVRTGSSDFCRASCLGALVASSAADGEELRVWRVLSSEEPVRVAKPELWDGESGEAVQTGMCMENKLVAMADGRQVLLGLFENGWLYAFDVRRGEWMDALALKLLDDVPMCLDVVVKSNKVLGVACGVDARLVAFTLQVGSASPNKSKQRGHGQGQRHLFEKKDELKAKVKATVQLRPRQQDDKVDESSKGFSAVRIAHNSRVVACAGWDGSVRLVDWHNLKPLGSLAHHSAPVRALAFSPDTTMLVSGAEDAHAVCWDLPFEPKQSSGEVDKSQQQQQQQHPDRLLAHQLIAPYLVRFEGSDIEVSAHTVPKALLRDVAQVFSEALAANPKLDKHAFKLVPTVQETKLSILAISDDTAQEKDRCLEVFEAFAKRFCNLLRSRGQWADFCDPCSGLPMFSDGNTVYSEIQGLEKVRRFPTTHAGSCRVALHTRWGPNMYPASMFTDADADQIQQALHDLDLLHVKAADLHLQKKPPVPPKTPVPADDDHPASCECARHRPRHPWFAAQAQQAQQQQAQPKTTC